LAIAILADHQKAVRLPPNATEAAVTRREGQWGFVSGKSNSRPIFRGKPMINPSFVELFANCFHAV
jgi:hypothetical protein